MPKATRRDFLGAAAATQVAPRATAPETRTAFRPDAKPRRLSENLWLFEDTCNVYVIRADRRALLVDFGSGGVLDHLPAMGVSRVDGILHTHHHRDQCQGDGRAVARGIPIHVPAHERHLFEDARNFWRSRRVFHLYYVRNDFNTITDNVAVASALADYSSFRWREGGLEFLILPTPGHTLGSITLVVEIDKRKVAFAGDLMYAPGKIQNLYDTQITYGGTEGIDLGIYSLERLREQKPALLCPSHGEPLPDPDAGMRETSRRLSDYFRFQNTGEPIETFRPYVISPHLIGHHLTTSSFYAIVSDSGKALFIDYGSASNTHFNTFMNATATMDRIRFVEHSIARLKREYGVKSVDVAMPSHMHDDHLNGFPHLIRHYGTRVWCYENMVDVLENPRGYNLGCILAEPFKVERAFRHGERFRWEEFEFEVTHSPGHTEYQMALFGTIDNRRVAFTGDAFFMPNARNDGTMRHNLIFRNHVESDSHLKSIRNLIEHEPETICPGHGRSYPVDRALMLATEQKLRQQRQLFEDLLPEGETNFGLDPSWVSIYPYQGLVAPGKSTVLQVRVRNYHAAPMKLDVALVTPAEWRVVPDVVHLEVPAGGTGSKSMEVRVPRNWTGPQPRLAIAADVVQNGKYLGQITEAVLEVAEPVKRV
jgi:glyoxylase-like metal-dependent hydrolase (beta-lactamase superfamily II)